MSSSSRSRGKKPQDPDPDPDPDQSSNGANSSAAGGSGEVNRRLGFRSTSAVRGPSEEVVAPLRRSSSVRGSSTAVSSSKGESALQAMHVDDLGYDSPTDDVPIAQLMRENRWYPIRSSGGGAVGKSGGEIGSKRKRGWLGKGVRIGGNNGGGSVVKREIGSEVIVVDDDEYEEKNLANSGDCRSGSDKIAIKEERVNLRSTHMSIDKGKGKLVNIDEEHENTGGDGGGASRREKVITYKRRGKEKVIEIVDSEPEPELEPDMVPNSNLDLGVSEELMEQMRTAVKDFILSLSEQIQVEPQPGEIPEEMVENRRREQQRNKAKQLASTFARFFKEKGDETVNDEVPFPDGPGPFSAAMGIIEDRAAMFGDGVKIPWTPSNDFQRGLLGMKMPPCRELALMSLAENAEALTSLSGIPHAMRSQLSFVLCRTRKMNMNLLTMLMEGNLTDLKLSDCSWANEKNFEDAFGNCDKSNLEVLELDQCGRCMPDSVVRATLAPGPKSLPSLRKLSFKGHYSLSNKGLAAIVSSAPLLNSLNLSQCTLLTTEGIINLIDKQALLLKELYIDECQNLNAMTILPFLKKVKSLKVLSMAGIPSVSNEFVHELIPVCGSTIWELNFADCDKLTSSAIKVIGENCPKLKALDIRNLTQLKDSAIAHLANGCRAIEKLQLRETSFSDEVIATFVRASGEKLIELSLNKVSKVGNLTAIAIVDVCRFHLKMLDLSFCRNMDDNALGAIVDSCSSLKTLKLFGCPQVTDRFLKGYFNRSVRILGVNGISLDYIETPYF